MYLIDNRDSKINELVNEDDIYNIISNIEKSNEFNIDCFYKICYLESILELMYEKDFKGFTLDDVFGKVSILDGASTISKFQSNEVLQRKIIDAEHDVYSFEWNEGEKKHMWKCVLTDINNILNLIYSEGLFKIIVDFKQNDIMQYIVEIDL